MIRAGGIEIFLKDAGEGSPTLFLHGNPDSSDLWDDVIERLPAGYHCIAPDLPGFGRSGGGGSLDCSLAGLARWVHEVVEAVGIGESLNLVVHDLGGFAGLAWAVENPARVRRVAVLNTAFSSRYRWHFWGRVWRTPLLGEVSAAIMNWPLFRSEMRRGSRHLSDEQIRAVYRRVTPKTKRAVLKLYRAADPQSFRGWEERLHHLTASVPTLVLWGDRDPYIAPSFADSFGTDNVRHFPDHGHWLPAEAPAEVAAALADHFA